MCHVSSQDVDERMINIDEEEEEVESCNSRKSKLSAAIALMSCVFWCNLPVFGRAVLTGSAVTLQDGLPHTIALSVMSDWLNNDCSSMYQGL